MLSLKNKSLFLVLDKYSWDKCINWTRSNLAEEYGALNFPVPLGRGFNPDSALPLVVLNEP